MAQPADMERLQQGVEFWNAWRQEAPGLIPDLSGADLNGFALEQINFRRANLTWTRLGGAVLTGADLEEATLVGADLSAAEVSQASLVRANLRQINLVGAELRAADLSQAILDGADLIDANLSRALLHATSLQETDLSGASLCEADLRRANLTRANLSNADLRRANLVAALLRGTILRATNLSQAIIGETVFGDVDFQGAHGLEQVIHQGPSTLGVDTLYRSRGEVPEVFLQGVGMPAAHLSTCISSIREQSAWHGTCLISYALEDQAFVDQLATDLRAKGMRCWLLPGKSAQSASQNEREEEEIPRSTDHLLLVVSSHALQGGWPPRHVQQAEAFESRREKRVLFPLQLDETLLHTPEAWASSLRHLRKVSDFRGWTQPERYQETLGRLYRELTSHAR